MLWDREASSRGSRSRSFYLVHTCRPTYASGQARREYMESVLRTTEFVRLRGNFRCRRCIKTCFTWNNGFMHLFFSIWHFLPAATKFMGLFHHLM